MNLLEVLKSQGEGWTSIGHPATLEEAITMGKAHGNGLYVFLHFDSAGLKREWFGLHNGEFAGINPYGWPKD